MSNMTPQETQRVMTMLRKEDSKVSKHMQKVEDLTSQNTNRDAYREARSSGHMKYIYDGKVYSTQLKTESPTEWVETLTSNAKTKVGPKEIGAPEEPLMQEKISVNEIKFRKLIIEQLADKLLEEEKMKFNMKTLRKLVVEELSTISEQKERIKRRRASAKRYRMRGLKKGQWPQDRERFKVPGNDTASFQKFYAAIRDAWNAGNRDPWRLLGGRGRPPKRLGRPGRRSARAFDYNWGDRHSDAYGALTGRELRKRTDLTDKDVDSIKGLEKQAISDPKSVIAPKGTTDKGSAVYSHRLATRKLDAAKEDLEKTKSEMKRMDAQDREWRKQREAGQMSDVVYRSKSRPAQDKFKILSKRESLLIKRIKNLENIISAQSSKMGELDSNTARMKSLGIQNPQELKPFVFRMAKEFLGIADQFKQYVDNVAPVLSKNAENGDELFRTAMVDPEQFKSDFKKKDWPGAAGYIKQLEKIQKNLIKAKAIPSQMYVQTDPMVFNVGKKTAGGSKKGIVQTKNPASPEMKKLLKKLEDLRDIKRNYSDMIKRQGKMPKLNKMIKDTMAKIKAAGGR